MYLVANNGLGEGDLFLLVSGSTLKFSDRLVSLQKCVWGVIGF